MFKMLKQDVPDIPDIPDVQDVQDVPDAPDVQDAPDVSQLVSQSVRQVVGIQLYSGRTTIGSDYEDKDLHPEPG